MGKAHTQGTPGRNRRSRLRNPGGDACRGGCEAVAKPPAVAGAAASGHNATTLNIEKGLGPDTPVRSGHPDDYPHTKHYDVRLAAPSYSNVAAVLSGFALAALVLVMQVSQLPNKVPNPSFLRDWASIAFLIAFFGCILSSFMFAIIAAEEGMWPRTNVVALFVGFAFGISVSLILWGLVELSRVFLASDVSNLSRTLYYFFVQMVPAYLVLIALDNIYLYGHKHGSKRQSRRPERSGPTREDTVTLFLLGYAPLATCTAVAVCRRLLASPPVTSLLWIWAGGSVVVILGSAVFALWVSDSPPDTRWAARDSGIATIVSSAVLGFLVLSA